MDTNRADTVARLLASRSIRRAAIAAGGAGLAAAALTRVAPPTKGQGATSAATAVSDAEFLFVQTFESGTWAPKSGEDGTFLLTLTGHAAQTVYFSDRPERIVGTLPTPQFLDNLGFTPANPPNAALVAQTNDGEDVVVVELLNPVYTEDFGPDGDVTVTYEARVLADYAAAGLAHLAARQTDATVPASFGPTSLFIDDCPDFQVDCIPPDDWASAQTIQDAPQCWSWNQLQCVPCGQDDSLCNETFPRLCKGACHACRPVWSISKGAWDCNWAG
jgi:hypothetical protein